MMIKNQKWAVFYQKQKTIKNLIGQISHFSLPKWRKGNFFSRLVRLIFEKPKTKKFLGLSLPIFMLISGQLTSLVAVAPAQAQTNQPLIIRPPEVLKTFHTFQKPVIGAISQGYHWYHPAVDIADNQNANVYPISGGKVIETGYQFFGYGNYIIVQHSQNLISLYAHLQRINVKVGDEVKMETILGKVGSTGRSTGPHLHLEIKENGVNLNPYFLIENL